MTNKYIEEFLSLRCAPDVLATVGKVANMQKEITESMAIIRQVRKIIIPEPTRTRVLFDLCAGNALTSVLSAHLFPYTFNYAFDKQKRDRSWYLTERFRYWVGDIYNPKLLDSWAGVPGGHILISSHPCQNLANEIIRKYHQYPEVEHLILLPCCSGRYYTKIPGLLQEKLSSYERWCYSLYRYASDVPGECNMYRDEHIMSPANIIITAHKTGFSMPQTK